MILLAWLYFYSGNSDAGIKSLGNCYHGIIIGMDEKSITIENTLELYTATFKRVDVKGTKVGSTIQTCGQAIRYRKIQKKRGQS